jgi:hypothetical protein
MWLCIAILVLFTLVACKPTLEKTVNGGEVQNIVNATNDGIQPTDFEPIEKPETPAVMQASLGENLWLKIDEPQDGAVVNARQVDIKGHASLDAVVTINNEILFMENSQDFTTTLNLTAGANLFEITASDIQGSEVTLYLTIYYEP